MSARAIAPRLHPHRIGLLCIVDLIQDAELIAPIFQAAQADQRVEVQVIATDWLDRVAPQAMRRIAAAGATPIKCSRSSFLAGRAPNLSGWNAVLTASESSARAHRFAHTLTKRAKAAGLATFTLQHGLENVGLNDRSDGDFTIAADWILTWGDPAHLPRWVSDDLRKRCIGVGRTAAAMPAETPAALIEDQRPTIAVFENLHWRRYNDAYRRSFLADLAAAAAARPDLMFVVKPHPAGQYLVTHRSSLASVSNVVLASPHDARWADMRAADLIARASAIITTPSTVALDAALQNKPVAIAGAGQTLESYDPLPILNGAHDWLAFIDAPRDVADPAKLLAFRRRHVLDQNAPAAVLNAVVARVGNSAPATTPRSSLRRAFERGVREMPKPIAAPLAVLRGKPYAPSPHAYRNWLTRNASLSEADRDRIREISAQWPQGALISVIVDARGAQRAAIERTIASIKAQLTSNHEIVLCEEDGAAHLKAALAQARGAFAAIVESGDTLVENALFVLTLALQTRSDALVAYSDEDRTDADGARSQPHFKPEWDFDFFLCSDYACRLAVFETAAARNVEIGAGSTRAAVYGLIARMIAAAPTRPIIHAPFVLYNRRADAPDLTDADRASMIASALALAGDNAEAAEDAPGDRRRMKWRAPAPAPLVTAIVPTRDRLNVLRPCIDRLLHATDYPALEIIIVDNDSRETATRDYLTAIAEDARVRVVPASGAFNFARLNNIAANEARGALLALVNNDVFAIHPDWLSELVSLASRADVGAAGPMLLYRSGAIQHAGCVLGMGGVAAHVYAGLNGDAGGHGGILRCTHEVSAVTAACLVTRAEVWRRTGGLDEALPVAYNDIDYCMRVREAGLRVIWTPFARLAHHESSSRGRDENSARQARLDQDKALMRARWGEKLAQDAFYSPNLSLTDTGARLAPLRRLRAPWEP